MGVADQAQTEAIARGLRFDAAELSEGKRGQEPQWIARASSSPQRGQPVVYVGTGKTAAEAHRALIDALPPRADQSGPTCPLCHQALPEGMTLGTPRYDAPD